MESDNSNMVFNLELPNMIKSLSSYIKTEENKKQLVFDPPVYLCRYSAVNSILSLPIWCNQIKKVKFSVTNALHWIC